MKTWNSHKQSLGKSGGWRTEEEDGKKTIKSSYAQLLINKEYTVKERVYTPYVTWTM